jgi:hypothetical protein
MPAWAWRLLTEGIEPKEGEPGYDQHFGWCFCGETVPGLPNRITEDDERKWQELRAQVERAASRRS